MSVDLAATEQHELHSSQDAAPPAEPTNHDRDQHEHSVAEEESEEDEEEDEPKLKYAKLTGSLTSVYRNGDSTSAFTVAGDKMVLGTHNGNVHVLTLPSLQSLKTYHAHSATITSVSVSPTPPPPAAGSTNTNLLPPPSSRPQSTLKSQPQSTSSPRNARAQQPPIPNTPNNAIHMATSSLDGHVCIYSLLDTKDVQLRNFARPVQAVALSPDYKNDRTYLSGGLAGNLILTVGGKAGVTADANTNSAAAAASGWLGSIGLGADRGRDTVLHSGEGGISTIKWSLTGKWVAWVNEEGIKIMRSHLKLGSEESEDAWRRIAHASKPNRKGWEDMAGVWRGKAEWVDDRKLEVDEEGGEEKTVNGVNGMETVKGTQSKKRKRVETLVVGWGDTAWILHVHEGGTGAGGKRQVGSADIVHKLQFRDCVVSGISLYTPSLLAILAYRTLDDNDEPIQQHSDSAPKKGRHHRQNGVAPELRLINSAGGEEVDLYELPMSRFETLSAQDYHLHTLFIPQLPPSKSTAADQRGALEGLWDAAGGKYASKMFSSGASVLSRSSDGNDENGKASFASPTSSALGVPASIPSRRMADAHPYASESGLKLFVQSPYDCVLAIRRGLEDHLSWLLEQRHYAQAWQLVDSHPEIISESSTADRSSTSSQPSTPTKAAGASLADFFADDASQTTGPQAYNSAAQKEKRRIGDLWLRQLVSSDQWAEAGKVAGKVLGTSSRWEHWIFTFAQAEKFDEVTSYIPSTALRPPLPSVVYEVVLGHYIVADPSKVRQLLEEWDPGLFDVRSVISAVENRLDGHDVDEDTLEDGVQGRDWRILMEALAKLYLADGRAREALRCYIRIQNADKAFELIKEEKLLDAVADDVPGLLMLRVGKDQMRSAELSELEDASSEAVKLLVEEAHRGTVMPATVIAQLKRKGKAFQLFLFFYLRSLWRGPPKDENQPRRKFDSRVDEGHALVEDHADLAVELFAEYDRDLLMTFLRASSLYRYEKAAQICDQLHYIPELVYVLSKTGQTKRALFLIIDVLGDVRQAIGFAKENPDLWDDLLDYSMDKPSFIRGLLEEVGTAIDPRTLVRRIPEGLEIEGLRQGIAKMMRDHDIQFSISEGVAKVLRGEVVMGMDTLRAGQKKAVKFQVVHDGPTDVEVRVKDPPARVPAGGEVLPVSKGKAQKVEARGVEPGHCVGCGELFHEDGEFLVQGVIDPLLTYSTTEKEPLIGFACGHVYHLSCLLNCNPSTSDQKTIECLAAQLSGAGNEDEGYGGRSVGAKVAHAHIIKNVIRGGCRHCFVPEGA